MKRARSRSNLNDSARSRSRLSRVAAALASVIGSKTSGACQTRTAPGGRGSWRPASDGAEGILPGGGLGPPQSVSKLCSGSGGVCPGDQCKMVALQANAADRSGVHLLPPECPVSGALRGLDAREQVERI